MKNSSVTVQIIEPDDGMWLTQAEDVEILTRIFSKKVYLAVNDSEDNWREITQEEYEQYQAQFEEAMLAEQEAMAAMQQSSEPEDPVVEEEQD